MPQQVDIGAYYQCFKQPKAFIQAIANYRHVYPTQTLVVVSDNGYNYKKYVETFRGIYTQDTRQSGNDITNALKSAVKARLYLDRFFDAVCLMKDPYFMLLEDDVLVCAQVPLSCIRYDITGCNNSGAVLWPNIVDDLRSRGVNVPYGQYYGACGGTIFRTAFFRWIRETVDIDEVLSEYGHLNPNYDSDILLSYITLRFGGSVGGPPVELGDTTNPNWQAQVAEGVIKIVHDYKSLYNIPLTNCDKVVLGWM